MISIIIPTYCPGSYLYECIKSINKQTYVKDKLEVIIILNGIRFPYEIFVKDIINKFQLEIKYLYTDEKGVSAARNLGLDYSKGEYVLFLDDDDLLSENYLLNLINKLNDDNEIIASNVYSFYEDCDEKIMDYLTYHIQLLFVKELYFY